MSQGDYVPGSGNPCAKLMIVAEAPGFHEDQQGIVLVGPSGSMTWDMLKHAGLQRSDTYATNVVKHRPPDNKLHLLHLIGHTVDEYIPQLWEEVKAIRPNCILALGNLALKTLTGKSGILNYRGSILQDIYGFTKVVATIHPAALMHGEGDTEQEGGGAFKYSSKVFMQLDFNRAVEESRTKALILPSRVLQVARNSSDVYNFIKEERGKGRKRVGVDIETIRCVPSCVGLAFHPSRAISIPLINMQGKNSFHIPHSDLGDCWRQVDKLLTDPEIQIVGQNFKFDHEKLLRPIGMKIPEANVFGDTMLLAHTIHPELPKSLQWITSVYTREPFYKDEGRDFNPIKDSVDQLYLYNCKDAAVTIESFEVMLKDLYELGLAEFFFEFVMKLHGLYMDIEKIGLKVNPEKRQALFDRYSLLEVQQELELHELLGHQLNVNSPKQVVYTLHNELKLPRRKGTGEDELVALMANNAKTPTNIRILELIINLRRIKKTKSLLKTAPDYDGRMRTSYRIVGTETGRTSTSKLEAPVRPHKSGHSFHGMTKHGELGGDFRSQFDADEGRGFLEVDLSQAEARVVAVLSDDMELLRLFDTIDIHKRTAHWCLGCNEAKVSKEERFIGKIARHGGNYDMGKRRLMMEINSNAKRFGIDVNVSEWKAGEILKKFHHFSPKIRGIFHEEIRRLLEDRSRTLINPFGRRRQFLGRYDDSLFKEGFAQIPQSTVSDHLKMAALRIRRRIPSLWICLESHDALLVQPTLEERDNVARVMKEEFEKPIDFSRCSIPRGELIIPCEIKWGFNYKDLKDLKVA